LIVVGFTGVFGAVLVAPSAAYVAGGAPVVAPRPAVDVTAATQDPAKLQALQDINDVLDKDPDHFAGSSTDGPSKITVYLAGDTASGRAAVTPALRRAESLGIRTEVQHRKYTLRELTTLKDSIQNVEPFASLGNDLRSWGVDTENNRVRVGVTAVTPELVDRVRAVFGDKVALEQGVRAAPATGRFNNNPNYLGGNRIYAGNMECTGGFSILNATGQRYALTAGHCFRLNDRVFLERSNNFFGTVQFGHYNDSVNIDMELVGVDVYRGGIWIGPVEGDLDTRPVRSARNSCRGCEIDFDGSVTGQSRGHLVSEGNSTDCIRLIDDNAVVCHVVEVRGDNGAALCRGGDSGGPVFAFDGQGGVIAVGIIEAVAVNPDHTINPNTCWYTRIVPILAHYTSTIYTVY
jgi:hypothetical protein